MNAKTKAPAAPTRKPVVATDIFGTTLTLNFLTGEELSINLATLSDEIRTQAALHGLKQKLVDAAAIARNPDTGLSATPADKYDAVKTVFDRITQPEGTWNAVRESGEKHVGGLFARALMELTGKTKAQIDVAIEKYTKEETAALKKNPRVVDIMQRLEREAIAARPNNSDDLLAQLANDDDSTADGE